MTTLQEARRALAARVPRSVASDDGPRSYLVIAGASALLLGIGIVMVLSATSITSIRQNDGNPFADFLSQGRYVLLGLPLAFLASRLPVATYKRLAWPALLGSLALQFLIFTPLGISEGGNTNWIWIPGIGQTLQPSEFLKIGLAVWLGYFLAMHRENVHDLQAMAFPLGLSGLALLLVLGGHDLGTSIVLVMMIVGAFWMAGVPMKWFAVASLFGVVALSAAVVSSPSRMARVLAFVGLGSADPTGAGYQSIHGLWGLGTGGLTGVGLGASREKWAYLPAAHNDFIFAILGEELGLLGTLLVLFLFGVLAYGMMRMIRRHPDPFVKITTTAIMFWIIGQALVNIGVVIGLLPVIGVPLPLVSAGGSAMISTLIALGILISFARDEPGAKAGLGVSATSVRSTVAVTSSGLKRRIRRD